MKKLFLMFGILIILLPFAFAQLEIERLKVYVNDVRQITLEDITEDEDGGTVENTRAGDILDLSFRFKNNWNETIEDIEVGATIEDIDDGDNLIEKIDKFDLEAEKEVTKKISFTIPAEVKKDYYNMFIEITGESENYTYPEFTIEFEIDVISGEEERFSLIDAFEEMTNTTKEYLKRADEKFDYADRIEQCRFSEGEYKGMYETCITNSNTLENDKNKCEYEKNKLQDNVTISDRKLKQGDGKGDDWIVPVGIVGAVWYFTRKKKKEEEEMVEESETDKLFK